MVTASSLEMLGIVGWAFEICTNMLPGNEGQKYQIKKP